MFAMVEPRRHDHDILTGSVGAAQDFAQVIKIFRIAYRNQNISRAHAQCIAVHVLVPIDAELGQAFRLAVRALALRDVPSK